MRLRSSLGELTLADTLRSCIVAESGYTFLSLDANQIELRVLAILSQDPRMLEDLRTGDLHMATAVRMFGHTDDEAEMKSRRYKAKQGNFANVFEAGEETLAGLLECSEEEAAEFMQEHRDTYPTLYQWMDDTKAKAKEDGYVINMFGRIRPLPELYDGSWRMRERAEKKIVNTIVQGTAVDIVKLAMLCLRGLFSKEVRLVLQVHDEILWECPDSLLQQSQEQCQELTGAFPDYPFSISTGKVYGEMEKINGN